VVWLVSELATNAVMHGKPPHAVVVDVADDVVRVSIEDGDADRTPAVSTASTSKLEARGHGLKIVASLADDWGWHLRETEPGGAPIGKAVWFTIGSKEQSQ
jgi:anti-sigma regulatory factor (Ser/Thr protein kinase)